MKTVKYFLAFIVVIGLIAGMTSCQQKQEEPQQAAQEQAAPMRTLVVATDATWPPMEMIDKDKSIVGFDIDMQGAERPGSGSSSRTPHGTASSAAWIWEIMTRSFRR